MHGRKRKLPRFQSIDFQNVRFRKIGHEVCSKIYGPFSNYKETGNTENLEGFTPIPFAGMWTSSSSSKKHAVWLKNKTPWSTPFHQRVYFQAWLDLKHLAHRSWQHHRSFSLGKCFVIHWRVLWDICGLNECRFLGCRYQETMSIEDILHGHFPKHHPYRTIMYELKAKDWDQCKIFFMSSLLYHPTSRSFMVESVLVVVFSRKRLNFSWEATMLPVFFALKLNCDEKQVHWKVSWLNGS